MEYCKDEFVAIDEILELYRSDTSEKENQCAESKESPCLSRNAIGRIIQDVWGSQGVRSKRVGKRGEKSTHGYINLRKKMHTSADKRDEATSVSSINSIEAEVVLENWRAIRNGTHSLSFVRNEKWAFNGQRVCTEILVTSQQGDVFLEILSQGLKKSIRELGLEDQLRDVDASSRIRLVAAFLDSSKLCAGITYEDYECMPHSSEDSIFVSFSMIDDPGETPVKKIFSLKCGLLAPPEQCCQSCSGLKRNLKKRQKRRESSTKESVYVNERYLSAEGLARKVAIQKRQIKNGKARERRMQQKFEEELIAIEESDHTDLAWMIENLGNEKDIPTDMTSLWDQQKRLLETSSKKGYRWHPK